MNKMKIGRRWANVMSDAKPWNEMGNCCGGGNAAEAEAEAAKAPPSPPLLLLKEKGWRARAIACP